MVDQTPVSGSTDELTFVRIGLYPDPHERETRERPRDELPSRAAIPRGPCPCQNSPRVNGVNEVPRRNRRVNKRTRWSVKSCAVELDAEEAAITRLRSLRFDKRYRYHTQVPQARLGGAVNLRENMIEFLKVVPAVKFSWVLLRLFP